MKLEVNRREKIWEISKINEALRVILFKENFSEIYETLYYTF